MTARVAAGVEGPIFLIFIRYTAGTLLRIKFKPKAVDNHHQQRQSRRTAKLPAHIHAAG